MKRRPFSFIVLILLIGALIGSALGEIIAFLLPSGVVEQFLLRAILIGFEPFTVNLGMLTFTLGFSLKINITAIIGIAVAAYILRWYHNERHF